MARRNNGDAKLLVFNDSTVSDCAQKNNEFIEFDDGTTPCLVFYGRAANEEPVLDRVSFVISIRFYPSSSGNAADGGSTFDFRFYETSKPNSDRKSR